MHIFLLLLFSSSMFYGTGNTVKTASRVEKRQCLTMGLRGLFVVLRMTLRTLDKGFPSTWIVRIYC